MHSHASPAEQGHLLRSRRRARRARDLLAPYPYSLLATRIGLKQHDFQYQRDRISRAVTYAAAEIARALTAQPVFTAVPHSPDAL